jgi:sugar phosphate isomerase/epimerase
LPGGPDRQTAEKPESRGPRFSLAHLTVLGCPPPEATRIAARFGYDFVSYRIIPFGLPGEPDYALAHNRELLQQTRAALAETGLQVHDVELARIDDSVNVRSYAPALETAAELGARYVLASIWTDRRDYAVESLGELCDLAAAVGLCVSLEFLTWTPASNLQQAADICRRVNRQNCGLMIDTLHFHRSRVALDELDELPAEILHFAHVCDAPSEIPSAREGLIQTAREARLYPGEGAIDVTAILDRLSDVVYSLEIPNLQRVREVGYAEYARLCLENAKNYLWGKPRGLPSTRSVPSTHGRPGLAKARVGLPHHPRNRISTVTSLILLPIWR